jgi:hypothetical protein
MGLISGDKDDFEILPTADMARGNFEMLQEAKNEIDLLGANAALAGKNENDLSGRAILAQQQGGMVEVARMFDRLSGPVDLGLSRDLEPHPPDVEDEKWIRITDDENNLRFVGLNQQGDCRQLAQEVPQGDQDAMQKASKLVGPQVLQAAMSGDQQAQTVVGMFVQQNGQQVVEVRNAVNELDVDIVIDEGMDTPSVQAEQFDTIVKMIPALGPVAQSPQFVKVMIEASQLRNKDKLVQMLEEGPTPEQQQMQQQQQHEGAADLRAFQVPPTSRALNEGNNGIDWRHAEWRTREGGNAGSGARAGNCRASVRRKRVGAGRKGPLRQEG